MSVLLTRLRRSGFQYSEYCKRKRNGEERFLYRRILNNPEIPIRELAELSGTDGKELFRIAIRAGIIKSGGRNAELPLAV